MTEKKLSPAEEAEMEFNRVYRDHKYPKNMRTIRYIKKNGEWVFEDVTETK